MQAVEKTRKILNVGPLAHFPNGHILAASALMIGLVAFTALPSDNASAKRKVQEINIPLSAIAETPESLPVIEPQPSEPEYATQEISVKSGDNLSRLFKRAGLNDRDMMELLQSHQESRRLGSLFPGHKLAFSVDKEGKLAKLQYVIDQLNSFVFVRDEESFQFEEIKREPDIRLAQASAFITHSLYTAGIDANLDDKLIMELAEIFGWDIDFALDIRKGDHFKVVYEEKFIDGEKLGNGSIIAAEFVNQGEAFQAVRYASELGDVGYYTPDGNSMRKEFLRAPVDFRRISSNFNPSRLHPVLKTKRPHRGIDYAAPTGTPVWASGAGRVIESGYSKANGNYVFIQHGGNIQTKYIHLHKRYVKKGDKVKQKQRIGSVGSTGLATGPHLHYEFLINGVHRNPRTIISRLPKAKSISPNEFSRFVLATRDLVAQLNEDFNPQKFATAEDASDTKNL